MLNLQREINILNITDPETSTSLIELIEEEERYVLIQDYVNGGCLNNVIACRENPLSEIEVQKIVQKLARGLNAMYERNIMHRDLNINNVMLHFPDLEPSQ